jgi:hypothetical protein
MSNKHNNRQNATEKDFLNPEDWKKYKRNLRHWRAINNKKPMSLEITEK